MIAKEETLNNSFYNPIQEVSKYIYPVRKGMMILKKPEISLMLDFKVFTSDKW
jgi:hypothetical protein